MSCDVAMAAYIILASTGPTGAPPAMRPILTAASPSSVASEPLFADIVHRAANLKAEVERYRQAGPLTSTSALTLPGFADFQTKIAELSALDMQGHVRLAKTGQDGDLKCILKGISQDLPVKMKALKEASTGAAQDAALREMGFLLRDNVEVITTPAKVTS